MDYIVRIYRDAVSTFIGSNGLHLAPRPMLAGFSGNGLYIRVALVLEYMMEKAYC